MRYIDPDKTTYEMYLEALKKDLTLIFYVPEKYHYKIINDIKLYKMVPFLLGKVSPDSKVYNFFNSNLCELQLLRIISNYAGIR